MPSDNSSDLPYLLDVEAHQRELVAAGALIPARQLVSAWRTTEADLATGCAHGDLAGLAVDGVLYYPSPFAHLPRDSVEQVCRALCGLDPAQAWVFWTRPHGALGGWTVQQALQGAAGSAAVLMLAHAWVNEEEFPK
jgi:hypothetical protein